MAEKHKDQVYDYVVSYCKLGVHPHQLAKALNLDESTVMATLKKLEKEGKIRLRSQNIEWKERLTR